MDTNDTNETIVLGDEFDDNLRNALMATLRELGGKPGEKFWGVGGSQELEKLVVNIKGNTITVEAETFIGLSIRGDSLLVQRIASLVRERIAHG